jgi:hypothetical protein
VHNLDLLLADEPFAGLDALRRCTGTLLAELHEAARRSCWSITTSSKPVDRRARDRPPGGRVVDQPTHRLYGAKSSRRRPMTSPAAVFTLIADLRIEKRNRQTLGLVMVLRHLIITVLGPGLHAE